MSTPDPSQDCCPATRYLRGQPERMVVDSYRHYLLAVTERDESHLNAVWNAHAVAMGSQLARLAMDGLNELFSGLGTCASCPLRYLAPKSNHLCREETLVLGMIAGIQNGQDETAWRCAEMLSCRMRCTQLVAAAGSYAVPLKIAGKCLMPLPVEILDGVKPMALLHENNDTIH